MHKYTHTHPTVAAHFTKHSNGGDARFTLGITQESGTVEVDILHTAVEVVLDLDSVLHEVLHATDVDLEATIS